jgi:hypothetical protein
MKTYSIQGLNRCMSKCGHVTLLGTKYTSKPNRVLYLPKIPIGTKFHTIQDRCFARHEPLGESKGTYIYDYQELEVVTTRKLPNGYWHQIKLIENNAVSQYYWVYDHCITPTKFQYMKAKLLNLFGAQTVDSNY